MLRLGESSGINTTPFISQKCNKDITNNYQTGTLGKLLVNIFFTWIHYLLVYHHIVFTSKLWHKFYWAWVLALQVSLTSAYYVELRLDFSITKLKVDAELLLKIRHLQWNKELFTMVETARILTSQHFRLDSVSFSQNYNLLYLYFPAHNLTGQLYFFLPARLLGTQDTVGRLHFLPAFISQTRNDFETWFLH